MDGTTGVLLGDRARRRSSSPVCCYEALPTAKWGRTLGKKLCGLRVRDIESQYAPASAPRCAAGCVYGVLGVLVIGVVNVVWCLFDRPWRQCWHDKAAHTFVAG